MGEIMNKELEAFQLKKELEDFSELLSMEFYDFRIKQLAMKIKSENSKLKFRNMLS